MILHPKWTPAISIVLLLTSCGSPLPSVADARSAFQANLNDRYGADANLLRIVSFEKTDAVQSEIFGVKMYTIQAVGEIEWPDGANQECIGASIYDSACQKKIKRLPGDRDSFSAKMLYEKHEKGWVRVRGGSMTQIQSPDSEAMELRRKQLHDSRVAERKRIEAERKRAEEEAKETARKRKIAEDRRQRYLSLLSKANDGDADAQNSLAWYLATTPDAEFVNGREAVEWAEKAVAQRSDIWYYVGTLAAAYARAGRFDEAVDAQERALQLFAVNKAGYRRSLGESRDNPRPVREMRARLELYRRHEPYTEK